jgi:hypothetical protein
MARRYVLTDVAGEHYWTGSGFLPVAWADGDDLDALPAFPSQRAAEAAVRRHRARTGACLKAARRPPRPVSPLRAWLLRPDRN